MAEKSVARKTGPNTAVRQPGAVSNSLRKTTNAGASGNVASGGGSGNGSNLDTGAQATAKGAPGTPPRG